MLSPGKNALATGAPDAMFGQEATGKTGAILAEVPVMAGFCADVPVEVQEAGVSL